jgi:hypothetical protein
MFFSCVLYHVVQYYNGFRRFKGTFRIRLIMTEFFQMDNEVIGRRKFVGNIQSCRGFRKIETTEWGKDYRTSSDPMEVDRPK